MKKQKENFKDKPTWALLGVALYYSLFPFILGMTILLLSGWIISRSKLIYLFLIINLILLNYMWVSYTRVFRWD